MPRTPSTPGADSASIPAPTPPTIQAAAQPLAPTAWDELSATLDELTRVAREEPDDTNFCRRLLTACVTALSANGGAVWSADPSGRIHRRASAGGEPDDRREHEALLRQVLSARTPQVVTANVRDGANLVRLISPVIADHDSAPVSIVEVALESGASPGVYSAAAKFLDEVCSVAAQREVRQQLRRARADHEELRRMADLGRRVQGDFDLGVTCCRIANEARDAIGCDRASVIAITTAGPRLMAVSGADRVDRRSRLARESQSLAALVARLREPLALLDGQTPDSPIEAAALVERYADVSHARQVVATPLMASRDQSDAADSEWKVVGVLIAEQFDAAGGDLAPQRIGEAAEAVSPALSSAVRLDELPLLGIARRFRGARSIRRGAIVLAVVAAAAAALLTPAELLIESRGELRPVNQRRVFAPGDCLVESVHAGHGDRVDAGDLLIRLRDPDLDLEIKQAEGELATARRRLDGLLATRTGADARAITTTERLRLSSEQQQLERRIGSLEDELALMLGQRDALDVVSPAAGTIVSWRVEQSLIGRPVNRGQELMSVADTDGDWRIELRTPDDRMGHVLRAQADAGGEPLVVEYRVASQERGFATGVVAEIAQRADAHNKPTDTSPTVLVTVTPDNAQRPTLDPAALRPGQSVRARIHCGRRSLAYVWLHDLGDALRTWWDF